MIDNDRGNEIQAEMADSPPTTAALIRAEVAGIEAMLLEKNRKYGDSALHPVRIFSGADPVEQLKVRLDDKLSRIRAAQDDDQEDAELDLLGYLVLLRCARRLDTLREQARERLGQGMAGLANVRSADFWGQAVMAAPGFVSDPEELVVPPQDSLWQPADPAKPAPAATTVNDWHPLPPESLGALLHCRRYEAWRKV